MFFSLEQLGLGRELHFVREGGNEWVRLHQRKELLVARAWFFIFIGFLIFLLVTGIAEEIRQIWIKCEFSRIFDCSSFIAVHGRSLRNNVT